MCGLVGRPGVAWVDVLCEALGTQPGFGWGLELWTGGGGRPTILTTAPRAEPNILLPDRTKSRTLTRLRARNYVQTRTRVRARMSAFILTPDTHTHSHAYPYSYSYPYSYPYAYLY